MAAAQVDLSVLINEQLHGYEHGHELLSSSVRLGRDDQDTIDRLSDLAGPLGPGDKFSPYLTGYPLPGSSSYVLARTWQDLKAPRAGCVLTRSLIVDLHDWADGRCLLTALRLLDSFPNDRTATPREVETGSLQGDLPSVSAPVYQELSEALFLERRRPIAIFGAAEADLATSRLILALWPGLRSVFSFCTHAYSPRQVSGRPFDLLFAPSDARVNFGRWDGRRIDGSLPRFEARHRWTTEIAFRIFQSPHPHTLDGQALHLVDRFSGDESALRLSLLWSELVEKAKVSPFAVLGLLDIVASQESARTLISSTDFESLIGQSIELASNSYTLSEFYDYLLTFLGKFPHRLPTSALLRKIRKLVARAAGSAPLEALAFLKNLKAKRQKLPAIIAAGLGDGVAAGFERHLFLASSFDADTLLELICYSRSFARALTKSLESSGDLQQYSILQDAVRVNDQDLRARARRHLVREFRSPHETGILRELLEGITQSAFFRASQALWQANRFNVPEFDLVLLRGAPSRASISELQEYLLHLPESAGPDRLLARTTTLESSPLELLLKMEHMPSRRASVSLQFVDLQSDEELRRTDRQSADVLLEFIGAGPLSPDRANACARILINCSPSIHTVVAFSRSILSRFDTERASKLATVTLSRLLKEAPCSHDDDVQWHVDNYAFLATSRDLAKWLVPAKAPIDRVSSNLHIAKASVAKGNLRILECVDGITERLLSRPGPIVEVRAIDAWASLIYDAGTVSSAIQLDAASQALQYAIDRKHAQVSSLVVVSFPVVYRHNATQVSSPHLFSFVPWMDWDKCQAMRADLVDMYMRSSWPAYELAIIAHEIDQLKEIVDLVLMRYRGHRYLEEVLSADDKLPSIVRQALWNHLSHNPRYERDR